MEPVCLLVGVAGKAGAGKDTVSQFLCDLFRFQSFAFAEPLKKALQAMLDLGDEHVNGELKECELPLLGVSPRRLMQTLGTEWGRDTVRQDFWLKVMERRYVEHRRLCWRLQMNCLVAVSDVRFNNEADWVRSQGGLVLHVDRDDVRAVSPHVSEAGVSFHRDDIRISNNGTLEDLQQKLVHIVNDLLEG